MSPLVAVENLLLTRWPFLGKWPVLSLLAAWKVFSMTDGSTGRSPAETDRKSVV